MVGPIVEGPPVERCERIGREVEGTSSNRPELGALALALQATEATHDLLYLCDNESVLKTIRGWIGEGTKVSLARAPDADILSEILEYLKF